MSLQHFFFANFYFANPHSFPTRKPSFSFPIISKTYLIELIFDQRITTLSQSLYTFPIFWYTTSSSKITLLSLSPPLFYLYHLAFRSEKNLVLLQNILYQTFLGSSSQTYSTHMFLTRVILSEFKFLNTYFLLSSSSAIHLYSLYRGSFSKSTTNKTFFFLP